MAETREFALRWYPDRPSNEGVHHQEQPLLQVAP